MVDGKKIIISLTTYPARINTINQVLDCLINQTMIPDKIILYLAEPQFPNKRFSVDLTAFKKYGFEIHWCEEDIGPHKKYFYAMQEFPDDIIITIDDDYYYKNTLIEELVNGYKKYPNAVAARAAHLITCLQDGCIAPYSDWYENSIRYVNVPRMDLCAIGCGGILYPPHVLGREVFEKDLFMQDCRYADDIWLKFMELLYGVPVVLVNEIFDDLPIMEYHYDGLYQKNNGNSGNDMQLRKVFERYNDYHGVNDTLADRLFSNGRLLASDVEHAHYDDLKNKLYGLIESINEASQIVIYGAGIVGQKVYNFLEKTGMCDKLLAFVVNDEKSNPHEISGYPVKNYREYITDPKVIYLLGLSCDKQEGVALQLIQAQVSKERIIKVDKLMGMTLNMFMKSELII